MRMQNIVITELLGVYRTPLDFKLVEVAGIEPASVSTLPSVLHA